MRLYLFERCSICFRVPEFGTVAARDHYVVRKRKKLGDFIELRAKTRELIDVLMPRSRKARSPDRDSHSGQRPAVARRYPRAAVVAVGRSGQGPALSA